MDMPRKKKGDEVGILFMGICTKERMAAKRSAESVTKCTLKNAYNKAGMLTKRTCFYWQQI
jgi:hypothetical protein